MTETTMYWITRLDWVRSLLNGSGVLCGVVFFVGAMFWVIAASIRKANERYNLDDYVDRDWEMANAIANTAKPFALWGLALSTALSVAYVFIPTTREMVAIQVVPAIASPEMCEKLKDVSRDFVDVAAEWLKDVKGGNKERKIK